MLVNIHGDPEGHARIGLLGRAFVDRARKPNADYRFYAQILFMQQFLLN